MEVRRRARRDGEPRLVQRLHHLLRYASQSAPQALTAINRRGTRTQRALLEVDEVLLDVRQRRRADDDRVPELALHEAVVRDPAQGDLSQRELVLLRGSLDLGERSEVVIVPVPCAVCLRVELYVSCMVDGRSG